MKVIQEVNFNEYTKRDLLQVLKGKPCRVKTVEGLDILGYIETISLRRSDDYIRTTFNLVYSNISLELWDDFIKVMKTNTKTEAIRKLEEMQDIYKSRAHDGEYGSQENVDITYEIIGSYGLDHDEFFKVVYMLLYERYQYSNDTEVTPKKEIRMIRTAIHGWFKLFKNDSYKRNDFDGLYPNDLISNSTSDLCVDIVGFRIYDGNPDYTSFEKFNGLQIDTHNKIEIIDNGFPKLDDSPSDLFDRILAWEDAGERKTSIIYDPIDKIILESPVSDHTEESFKITSHSNLAFLYLYNRREVAPAIARILIKKSDEEFFDRCIFAERSNVIEDAIRMTFKCADYPSERTKEECVDFSREVSVLDGNVVILISFESIPTPDKMVRYSYVKLFKDGCDITVYDLVRILKQQNIEKVLKEETKC